jgi:hypothetical protein
MHSIVVGERREMGIPAANGSDPLAPEQVRAARRAFGESCPQAVRRPAC